MEVVREVVDSELIGSVIALPGSFRHKKVEVLVLPFRERTETLAPKKSCFGALSKYANPSLIDREKDAWAEATAEKYAHR
jgi:hypothetical protein